MVVKTCWLGMLICCNSMPQPHATGRAKDAQTLKKGRLLGGRSNKRKSSTQTCYWPSTRRSTQHMHKGNNSYWACVYKNPYPRIYMATTNKQPAQPTKALPHAKRTHTSTQIASCAGQISPGETKRGATGADRRRTSQRHPPGQVEKLPNDRLYPLGTG